MPDTAPPTPNGLLRRVPFWVVLAGFLATVLLLSHRAIERRAIAGRVGGDPWAMVDFRDTIYYPAVAFLAGTNPWATRLAEDYPVQRPLPPYGPVVVLAHLPLGLLPVHGAEVVYFALTIGLTAVVAALALGASGLAVRPRSVLALATLMLLSRPGQQNLLLGQCTLEVVLGCALAILHGRQRPILGALGIVLASMKPQFALPLVLLMIARGDVRATAGGIAATGVLSLATLLAAGGVAALGTWVAAIGRSSATVADTTLLWPRIDAGFLARHVLALPTPVDLLAGPALLVVGLVAFRSASAIDRHTTTPPPLAIALACLTILLPLYHMAYDALLLTLPAVALVAAPWRAQPRAHGALLALLLVPALNFVATNTVVTGLEPHGAAWRIVTGINAAALVAALLLASWLTLARPRPPATISRPAPA